VDFGLVLRRPIETAALIGHVRSTDFHDRSLSRGLDPRTSQKRTSGPLRGVHVYE